MANSRQPIIATWLWPGLITVVIVLGTAVIAFTALWLFTPLAQEPLTLLQDIANDHHLWRIVSFTFNQALLSTLLSLLPAIPLAGALYRRHFPGRQLLLRLCAMTLVLPVLVAVVGLISVYGKQGWLAQLAQSFGLTFRFSLYGLHGILLAHLFFNLPLATRLLLQSQENIPTEQRQIAAQLGMSEWQRFYWIEWPALRRQLLPTGALIFMLCFASFTTVMVFGGGPRATTIELAIYQALRYDFDPQRAALLALIQLICCLSILLVSQRLSPTLSVGLTYNSVWRAPLKSKLLKGIDLVVITLALLFLIPPLLALIINGISHHLLTILVDPLFWQSVLTSLQIAIGSGLVSVVLVFMLLSTSRELYFRQHIHWAKRLEFSGMVILAMPAIVLATGLFLVLLNASGLPKSPLLLLVLINALMAMPYMLKVMTNPMYDLAERYRLLTQSLAITGWQKIRLIELPILKKPLSQALAFACVLSIGDFGVIALFGNHNFMTLPYYLYSQLGSYRSQHAAATSLMLMLLCFVIFTVIERLGGSDDQAR